MSEGLAEQDIAFLAQRACNTGRVQFSGIRDTGASSNALVALAYGLDHTKALPGDCSDLVACLLTYHRLPAHRKTDVVRERLEECKREVEHNYSGSIASAYARIGIDPEPNHQGEMR